ncbi:hypothetical protein OIE71_18780 [Streptomyces sp. NBC_01725]|uniref:hypothetical protein n=1 Tax=Streptomyces sp. NBC_01725 TaxID=2975923 RepID=UPI002E28C79E|nr:hypothetical protein [Streptomyces sp. NBC_01725]
MDSTELSTALRPPAHPQAKPGYGKRSVPGQLPRTDADFAHLRTREAAIAAYIDRLTEGAAIGYKALAANIADYGQQACAKSLKFLSEAGHLRLVKEHLAVADNSLRWVTRTYFSRTSRDDEWWKAYVAGLRGVDLTGLDRDRGLDRDHDGDRPAEPPAPAPPAPTPPTVAYRTLARLGRTEPRMTLSAAECAALESLAAQWLARGATPDHLTRSLTTGLPHPLHSPGAIARKRLESKMPPAPYQDPAHITRAVMLCIGCEEPETVVTLIGGVCMECREEMEAYDAAEGKGLVIDAVPNTFRAVPAQREVARRADELRAAAGLKSRPIPRPTHGEFARGLSRDVGAERGRGAE